MNATIAVLPFLLVAGLGQAATVSHYDHIFVIMEENHEYDQIIGNPNAPNINAYAAKYGSATDYDAVTHPSAPNYVALVGGSYFGIQDDNGWQTHELDQPSLTSQIDAAQLSWKGYFQSLPYAGFKGDCSMQYCYYASRHNGPIYYDSVNSSKTELKKEVPITKLAGDLSSGKLPNFAVIVPDICHDMHGGTGTCTNSTDDELVSAGDSYAAGLVDQITGAPFWKMGNNAIVLVWDEGTTDDGGGGHVPAVVITSHGPRGLADGTAYNHYGLLTTIQDALGLGCLQESCTATAMSALFLHK